MLQLGVAGVGQQFSRYREALRRLRNPVEIDAVYDCVFARAESSASHEEAAWESGLRGLARRHSVDAVLLLESGWHGLAGLHCLARCHKPVFVAPWLSGSATDFEQLYEAATMNGVNLMPALWRRYVPAAVRVQELIATEIGAVTEIEISLPTEASEHPDRLSEVLVGWLDFCRNLFRTFPVDSRFESTVSDGVSSSDAGVPKRSGENVPHSALNLVVEYPGSASDPESVPDHVLDASGSTPLAARTRRAILRMNAERGTDLLDAIRSTLRSRPLTSRAGASRTPVPDEIVPVRIACERGSAEIRSGSEIAWQVGGQPLESEKLTADRSEHDIMLDLFCRRVAGGLAPVPDYFDVSHALRIVEQAVSNADFV